MVIFDDSHLILPVGHTLSEITIWFLFGLTQLFYNYLFLLLLFIKYLLQVNHLLFGLLDDLAEIADGKLMLPDLFLLFALAPCSMLLQVLCFKLQLFMTQFQILKLITDLAILFVGLIDLILVQYFGLFQLSF